MRSLLPSLSACILFLPAAVSAQVQKQPAAYVPSMTFDVASVRESKPDANGWFYVRGGFDPSNGGNLRLENFTLRNLLTMSYPVNGNDLEGLPLAFQWATFNIDAKADPEADAKLRVLPNEQLQAEHRHMLQTLLADRMRLKTHWETRDKPAYDLVVARPGRLQSTGAPPSEEEVKRFGTRPVPSLYQQGSSMTSFHYIGHGATTEQIAAMLRGQFGAMVMDKTGLSGKYDFDLEYHLAKDDDREENDTSTVPTLETAVRDQLGLKLVRTHAPVQVLVIDHVEKPSEN